MINYSIENQNPKKSQIVFGRRSQTFDLNAWRPWKYLNYLFAKYEKHQERMYHFVSCGKHQKKGLKKRRI